MQHTDVDEQPANWAAEEEWDGGVWIDREHIVLTIQLQGLGKQKKKAKQKWWDDVCHLAALKGGKIQQHTLTAYDARDSFGSSSSDVATKSRCWIS